MSPGSSHRSARKRHGAQGALEYALVLGLVALLVLAAIAVVGRRASGSLCQVTGTLAGNLVANGDATCGTNANFSQFAYDSANPHNGHASFGISAFSAVAFSDALIPIDTTQSYTETMSAESSTHVAGAHGYLGLSPADVDGLSINPQFVMYQAGTTTSLATTLHPGDSTVSLTSAANWNTTGASYLRGIIFWNYVDGRGTSWPAQTYSRNAFLNLYAVGAITGSTITLITPWAGGIVPAGTRVSNSASGGSYMYCVAVNVDFPTTWTSYSYAVPAGFDTTGTAPSGRFWPGTAYARIMVLANRDVVGNVTNIADVSLTN